MPRKVQTKEVALAVLLGCSLHAHADTESVKALEDKVRALETQLDAARAELEGARNAGELTEVNSNPTKAQATVIATADAATSEAENAPVDQGFAIGPITIGGAMRVNYVYGDYETNDNGPSRGGNGGNVELDTFRINAALDYHNLIGEFEYRWYTAGSGESYNFMRTGWLGYKFDDNQHIEVGLNRVPFGAGPYGISQSWFFDQHYYVGLADDPDVGVKYTRDTDNWSLDLGYYTRSEPSFSGRSTDSTRYGYDAVRWNESVNDDGTVNFDGPRSGYREKDQFNARAITTLTGDNSSTDAGLSLQYGSLDGSRVDDGNHWAASIHAVHSRDKFKLGLQVSRFGFDIDDDNPWGTDALIPLGAYDFTWTVASKAWLPAISLSYQLDTPTLPWLDYALPYIEWSSIIKDEDAFNDSQLFVVGTAWASGGWYIYSDLAYSNGNYFVGNENDDYSRIDGVSDFGVNGNDNWYYRFNLNLGYYY